MSYKTDRLVDLFPDAYAAREAESLLYKLLDAFGAELMAGDEKIKQLLKSHWVRFAEGSALDALGAIYGVERRTLRNGQRESDQAFRLRLQATVPLFTGGGTRQAVLGAVRSALGLPFNLDQLRLQPQFQALREDIEKLVVLREFSPTGDRVFSSAVTTVALDARTNASELVLAVTATTVSEALPRIDWTFEQGGGRRLSVERLDSGQGFRSRDAFVVPSGKTLVLSAGVGSRLSVVLDGVEVGDSFVNLNGTSPALLPPVPTAASDWRFRAQSALYDVGTFDGGDTFDLPRFQVALSRLRLQPLTFDVEVPFFLQQAVADLKARHHFTGELFIFEGIPLERIQEVVDQTRAAGVRGSVHFSLTFFETHNQQERFAAGAVHAQTEDAGAADSLLVANTNEQSEAHDTIDRLTIAGVFDISPFDGPFGFL